MLVTVDQGPLDVRFEAGPEPALVFLHEGLGSIALWRTFPDDVRDATNGPATLVYSRHGYGRSAVVPEPRPVTFMHHEADVVLPQLLDHFGVEAPVVIGHSDGASIALLYAGSGRRVAGLVLLAPHVFVEDCTVAGIEAARRAYESSGLRDRMARHHHDVDATFNGWADVWLSPAFRSWDITNRLAGITCPMLVVQGDADTYGTLAQLDAIEAGVSGPTQRLVVPGAGHSPQLDAPDTVLPAVATFVRRLADAV